MGTVVFIEDWKRHQKRRHPDHPDMAVAGPEADGRLERAVRRLDAALRRADGHPAGMATVESELLAITGAVSIGRLDDAAARAERLADRLAERTRKGG